MRRLLPFPLVVAVAGAGLTGCARAPSPLAPHWSGSVGLPHRGVLVQPNELPAEGTGYRTLLTNDRHWATPRFVSILERAAARVERERPGSLLTIGDLSARHGGKVSSHSSHRTGRDADLLLYLATLDGAPVVSNGFVSIGPDGLGYDEAGKRFVRLDVEREWLLVKALVEDPEARVQWLFVSKPIEAMLLEWARARGESGETLTRAMDAMLQPAPPAQSHDDHVHVRTACDAREIAAGCEPSGPVRPWVVAADGDALAAAAADGGPSTLDLVTQLVVPLSAGPAIAVPRADDPSGKTSGR